MHSITGWKLKDSQGAQGNPTVDRGFRSSKRMKYLVEAVLIFFVVSSGTITIDACTCSAPTPGQAFRDAAAVFIGQVLETGLSPYGELYEKGYVSKIKFRIEKPGRAPINQKSPCYRIIGWARVLDSILK
jgi:hypothetical protein